MTEVDFNNKTFTLVSNSESGSADNATIFEYKQEKDIVTAIYYGGPIRKGNLIGRLEGRQLHMHYQCITEQNELKSGRAIARIIFTADEKMKLDLNWEWLNASGEKGNSEYLEN